MVGLMLVIGLVFVIQLLIGARASDRAMIWTRTSDRASDDMD